MNNRSFSIISVILCILLLLQSCATTKRNLVYFSDLSDSIQFNETITNAIQPKIQPGDALSIKVSTLNPDANILFNSGSLPMSNINTGVSTGVNNSSQFADGYIVDASGFIDFPQLGKILISGLTQEQAEAKIAEEVAKSAKSPIVNIRILNFRVTVIGEVAHPGIFNIPNNKINVLEALGLAGDMTPYAIRENVMVIRESNGKRLVEHINFNNKSTLNSPFYNLQQNDIVYVQPENKLKAAQAANPALSRTLPIISAAVSVIAILLSRLW